MRCRLEAYRVQVRERAKKVDAEDAKQRLRGQVLGKRVEGPDVDAFLRQLADVCLFSLATIKPWGTRYLPIRL